VCVCARIRRTESEGDKLFNVWLLFFSTALLNHAIRRAASLGGRGARSRIGRGSLYLYLLLPTRRHAFDVFVVLLSNYESVSFRVGCSPSCCGEPHRSLQQTSTDRQASHREEYDFETRDELPQRSAYSSTTLSTPSPLRRVALPVCRRSQRCGAQGR
jgi:hypothetical protein